ncbi:MAG: hypothetical protein EOP54_10040 [Sphingobacteriales bacterium]|nr:MAG: hypothetical protein EOP54_10040 [Sphingobacteriales bacterium]
MSSAFSAIYAAVLLPPPPIIAAVNLLKQQLADKIGPYKGLYSDAHITLCTFKATGKSLVQWETHIQNFANSRQALFLTFNRIACFSNGAFVLLPDEKGHEELHCLMKSFYTNRPKGKNNTSQKAHISIARGLNLDQQNTAQLIHNSIELSFSCNHIAIRNYNPATRLFALKEQYDLMNTQAEQI